MARNRVLAARTSFIPFVLSIILPRSDSNDSRAILLSLFWWITQTFNRPRNAILDGVVKNFSSCSFLRVYHSWAFGLSISDSVPDTPAMGNILKRNENNNQCILLQKEYWHWWSMNIDFEQNKDGEVTYNNKRAIPRKNSCLNVTGGYPWPINSAMEPKKSLLIFSCFL